jgi:hypothetical protein
MNKLNSITTIYLNVTSEKNKIRNLYVTISNDKFPIAVLGFSIDFKNKHKLSNIVNLIKTLNYNFSPIQLFKLESFKNGCNYITVNETRTIIIKELIRLFAENNIEIDTITGNKNITIDDVEDRDKEYYERCK